MSEVRGTVQGKKNLDEPPWISVQGSDYLKLDCVSIDSLSPVWSHSVRRRCMEYAARLDTSNNRILERKGTR